MNQAVFANGLGIYKYKYKSNQQVFFCSLNFEREICREERNEICEDSQSRGPSVYAVIRLRVLIPANIKNFVVVTFGASNEKLESKLEKYVLETHY